MTQTMCKVTPVLRQFEELPCDLVDSPRRGSSAGGIEGDGLGRMDVVPDMAVFFRDVRVRQSDGLISLEWEEVLERNREYVPE